MMSLSHVSGPTRPGWSQTYYEGGLAMTSPTTADELGRSCIAAGQFIKGFGDLPDQALRRLSNSPEARERVRQCIEGGGWILPEFEKSASQRKATKKHGGRFIGVHEAMYHFGPMSKEALRVLEEVPEDIPDNALVFPGHTIDIFGMMNLYGRLFDSRCLEDVDVHSPWICGQGPGARWMWVKIPDEREMCNFRQESTGKTMLLKINGEKPGLADVVYFLLLHRLVWLDWTTVDFIRLEGWFGDQFVGHAGVFNSLDPKKKKVINVGLNKTKS
ncbi:MAG: hypothetical protein ABIH58_01895 [Patescibacteria group bacterium]